MSKQAKFKAFKQQLVDENEKRYGQEARAKYGDKAVDGSNAKLKSMSQAQYAGVEALSKELNVTLEQAVRQGDPAGELAQKACALHKEWLCRYWPNYSKEAHAALAQTYVDDPRFAAYYDEIAPGAARFLRDALLIYCQ